MDVVVRRRTESFFDQALDVQAAELHASTVDSVVEEVDGWFRDAKLREIIEQRAAVSVEHDALKRANAVKLDRDFEVLLHGLELVVDL